MTEAQDGARQSEPRTVTGPVLPSRKALWKKQNPRPTGWASWWPVYAGIALSCIAPQLASFLARFEPWGMRAVFPFVLFSGLREIGMSDELTRTLPQLMLYLQFPLEGLLAKGSLSRGFKLSRVVGQLVFLHSVAALVLWIVDLGSAH